MVVISSLVGVIGELQVQNSIQTNPEAYNLDDYEDDSYEGATSEEEFIASFD